MERGILLDFNSARELKLEVIEGEGRLSSASIKVLIAGSKSVYPLIYQLLCETTRFYEEHFNQLLCCIAREKRQLNFESPNRVKMQYEYELENNDALINDIYFLFNTRSRLSWLTIEMEQKQVAVASNREVKKQLLKVLKKEVQKLAKTLGISINDVLDLLYNESDGKPTFVTYLRGTKSIKITYYDSMQQPKDLSTSWINKVFHPIAERDLQYIYRPLAANVNYWLYIKAPQYFSVEVDQQKLKCESPPSTDREVKSFVFIGESVRKEQEIHIRICVPVSMKFWYQTIFTIALAMVIILPICVLLRLVGILCPYPYLEGCIDNFLSQIPKGVYAIIAAILATRGWMIHEEYVLKTLSQWYTILTIMLLIETISILLLVH